MYFFQRCFIFRPSHFTMSEDATIEPRTVETSALVVRRSSHSAISYQLLKFTRNRKNEGRAYLRRIASV
jgi:hypothetical protein